MTKTTKQVQALASIVAIVLACVCLLATPPLLPCCTGLFKYCVAHYEPPAPRKDMAISAPVRPAVQFEGAASVPRPQLSLRMTSPSCFLAMLVKKDMSYSNVLLASSSRAEESASVYANKAVSPRVEALTSYL